MHRPYTKLLALLSTIVLLGALAGCGGASGGGPAVVKVGWIPSVNFIAWISAVDQLEQSGDVEVELVEFKSSSDALVALNQGAVDMTTTGYSVLADGLAQADLPVRYIAGISTAGAFFIARTGSGIETWEDLRGKRLGGVRGSAEYIHMNGSMERQGIDLGQDAEYVNFQTGTDVMLALRNGDIDATVSYEPLISEAILNGEADIVPALQEELYSASFEVSSGLLASEAFLEENPDETTAILEAYADQVEHLTDQPQDAKDVYLEYAPGDPKVIEEAINRVTVTFALNESEMRQVGSTLKASGQQSEDMGEELVDHLDYSYLAEATGKSPSELGEGQ